MIPAASVVSTRPMVWLVAGVGVVTVGLRLIGFETIGGLLALVHLGGLIGAPLALTLNRQLRSVPVVIALSIALSLALTALAVQSLIWFRLATGSLLLVVGTLYGIVLASLVGAGDERFRR